MFNTRIQLTGVTLIELLTAITLSLFILMALVAIFITSQKNQKSQYALDEIQEHAAQAFYYLQKNIRNAGVSACNAETTRFIKGSDDAIEIFKTASISAKFYQQTSQLLIVSAKPNIHKNDLILLSDCVHHEFLRVFSVEIGPQTQKIYLSTKVVFNYLPSAEIKRVDTIRFFVRKTTRLDQWKNPIYALYADKVGHRVEELVEGISALKFHFDIEINHAVTTKLAAEIADWNKVKGVEIDLQVSTVAEYPLQKELHSYAALHKNFAS